MKRFTRVAVLLLSLVLVLSMGIFASAESSEVLESADTTEETSLVSVEDASAETTDASADETTEDTTEESKEETSEEETSEETTEDSKEDSKEETSEESKEETSEETTGEASGETSEESSDKSENSGSASRDDGPNWTLIIFLSIVAVIVIVCVVCVLMKNKVGLWLIKFWKDYKSEITKVVWPSKEAIAKRTGVVLVCLIVCTVVMGLLDFGLLKLINWLISLAS